MTKAAAEKPGVNNVIRLANMWTATRRRRLISVRQLDRSGRAPTAPGTGETTRELLGNSAVGEATSCPPTARPR
jgi:hypothetical protein